MVIIEINSILSSPILRQFSVRRCVANQIAQLFLRKRERYPQTKFAQNIALVPNRISHLAFWTAKYNNKRIRLNR